MLGRALSSIARADAAGEEASSIGRYEAMQAIVVLAVVEDKTRILIGRQIEGEHPAGLGGKWVLPGGRVEEGESTEEALKREIEEETALRVEVRELLGERIDAQAAVRVLYFRCAPKTYDAKAGDDLQAVKWVERGEVLESLDATFVGMLPGEVVAYLGGGSGHS
jgi:8-oxo-dGTP diphosphatase